MRARLGLQETGRPKPPVATTWAAHLDPMVTPRMQNVLPHRDPMVTPMVQNVHPHLALMTLDIGNDALLCKVFFASLQGQALSWFHRLPPNSVDNFRDLSEAFVGQYLCSARHKQNISTLQNIKMQDNESLREFVKRFGQAVLQASRNGAERSAKLPDRPRPFDRRQEGPSRPERPPLTPLSISYEKLLPMIQDMSDFRWPRPLGTDPSKRDHNKKCVFHKEHGHTTETCRCLHYLVERLIRAGHLKQYLRSEVGGRDASRNHNSGAPRAQPPPKPL
ncbi:hypothetical protein CK203_013068 [Vitis vinifera]|uniref:Retrotransposon gag domain-containing protein n=1 Tax=Vitis vinifera TaxID=29760 RepID=A0A438JM40_VITVI|nr:hypothetical protein CK203_013068 [Vitis vinifera]